MPLLIRLLFAMLFIIGAAGTALADDPFAPPKSAEAKKHLDAGVAHFNLREWQAAVVEYKEGARLDPAPVFDYALGQAYRKSGDYESAEWHYARFVKTGQPTGEALAQIEEWRAQMKAEREKKAMSQPPSDAIPPASPPPASPPPAHGPDWVAWGLIGTGAVGLAVGGGFLWSAASLRDDANATPNQEDRTALLDRADTRSLLGKVFAIGGGAVAVAGVVKLALGHGDAEPRTTAWDLRVSPRSATFVVRF